MTRCAVLVRKIREGDNEKKEKFTQRSMADRLGISACYLSQIEKGHRHITPNVALKIQEAFGLSAEYIVIQSALDGLDEEKKKRHEKAKGT